MNTLNRDVLNFLPFFSIYFGKKNSRKLSIQSCLLDFCYYYNIRSCSYNAKVYNDGHIANIEERLHDICVCERLHDVCVSWMELYRLCFVYGWNVCVDVMDGIISSMLRKKRLAEATKADLAKD
jgi:hypothetical protein